MKFSVKIVSLALVSLLLSGGLTATYAQGRGRGGGMGGRSSRGQGSASNKSDPSMDAVRAVGEKLKQADQEMSRFPGLAEGLKMSATQLHDGYQAALANNPNLKFDQFVAANHIAMNLGNTNITADAILQGVASGKNIGQRLQELGLSSKAAKEAEKDAERQIKENKKQK